MPAAAPSLHRVRGRPPTGLRPAATRASVASSGPSKSTRKSVCVPRSASSLSVFSNTQSHSGTWNYNGTRDSGYWLSAKMVRHHGKYWHMQRCRCGENGICPFGRARVALSDRRRAAASAGAYKRHGRNEQDGQQSRRICHPLQGDLQALSYEVWQAFHEQQKGASYVPWGHTESQTAILGYSVNLTQWLKLSTKCHIDRQQHLT